MLTKNMSEIKNQKDTTQEQPTPLKERVYPRLTPEQVEIARQSGEALSKAVIQGLHEDNQEIFGEDYHLKNKM